MVDTCRTHAEFSFAAFNAADMLQALTRTVEAAMAVATQADAVTVDETILHALTCTDISKASTKFGLSYSVCGISESIIFLLLIIGGFGHLINFIFKN